jgi:hypothetical protein
MSPRASGIGAAVCCGHARAIFIDLYNLWHIIRDSAGAKEFYQRLPQIFTD